MNSVVLFASPTEVVKFLKIHKDRRTDSVPSVVLPTLGTCVTMAVEQVPVTGMFIDLQRP